MLLLPLPTWISAVEAMPETSTFWADVNTRPWTVGESPGLLVIKTGTENACDITACPYDPAWTTISSPDVAAANAWLRFANCWPGPTCKQAAVVTETADEGAI